MRFEYINPFVDSAQGVLKGLIPSFIERRPVTLNDTISTNGISATVFLAGSVEGLVVLDLEPRLAKKIAGFMNGIEFDRINHLAIDTICEITNIIIGKAVTLLNNKGFRFRPSPPYFFIGEKTYHGFESLCISLSTEWGDIKIQASIHERNKISEVERRVYD